MDALEKLNGLTQEEKNMFGVIDVAESVVNYERSIHHDYSFREIINMYLNNVKFEYLNKVGWFQACLSRNRAVYDFCQICDLPIENNFVSNDKVSSNFDKAWDKFVIARSLQNDGEPWELALRSL